MASFLRQNETKIFVGMGTPVRPSEREFVVPLPPKNDGSFQKYLKAVPFAEGGAALLANDLIQ